MNPKATRMFDFFKKLFIKNLYPELDKAGGLVNTLNEELLKINSPFRAIGNSNAVETSLVYARVEYLNKFSQVSIAAEEKLYLSDFWRDGVCLAHAHTDNISLAAEAIHYWLSENVLTSELANKYSFVKPVPKAVAFDEGREVEYAWNRLLNEKSFANLHSLLNLL